MLRDFFRITQVGMVLRVRMGHMEIRGREGRDVVVCSWAAV